jgi:dinuclear metal center YbgI/SA1388 family protein
MILAYHSVIFKPISRLTPAHAPIAFAAASEGFAVYSPHTALDSAPGGTNDVLAGLLGLEDVRPLEPTVQENYVKIVVTMPPQELSDVADAAFDAGAGQLGHYERCAFFSHGVGTFLGGVGSVPAIGQAGRQEAVEEMRLEVIAPRKKTAEVCAAIRGIHSYEMPAIDIYPILDAPQSCGMGRIGRLARPVTLNTLINRVKKATGQKNVLLATDASEGDPRGKLVSIAACGAGSCGSMIQTAAAQGATFFLTGEVRHHEALEAARSGVNVVCLGHSNSERMTLKVLAERISAVAPKLKVHCSEADRDPFSIV